MSSKHSHMTPAEQQAVDAELMEASAKLATLNRNSDKYDLTLEEMARLREQDAALFDASNKVKEVVVVERPRGGSHVELHMNTPHHRFKTREVGETIGHLLEAPVRMVREGTAEVEGPSYRQPPRHVHYKDDRRK